MTKAFLPFCVSVLLLVTACKKEYPIPPLDKDVTSPNLTVQFVSTASTYKFIPFGGMLNGGAATNPGYEIYVSDSNTASVIASAFGYVKSVEQSGSEYKIFIEPKRNSIYTMIYSHLRQVTLAAGDSVNAGTTLGKVGVGGHAALQVNKSENGSTNALCLDSLGSQNFRNAFATAMQKHNLYNIDSVTTPCLVSSLPQ